MAGNRGQLQVEVLEVSREKLKKAKEKLAQDEKSGTYKNGQELEKRRRKITTAEEKIKGLETAVAKEKAVLQKNRNEIEK